MTVMITIMKGQIFYYRLVMLAVIFTCNLTIALKAKISIK